MSRMVWPRVLNDIHRFDAFLLLTCKKCGHEAMFEGRAVEEYFRHMHWPTAWELIACRFKCGECGSKEIKAGMRARPFEEPKPRAPKPVG